MVADDKKISWKLKNKSLKKYKTRKDKNTSQKKIKE